jgi:hypothetical protein
MSGRPAAVGDYVYDWDLGIWGLIIEQLAFEHFVLLYEDSIHGEAYSNALTQYIEMSECALFSVQRAP